MTGDYHGSRLTEDVRRTGVWRALWHYFFRHRIRPDDCVLDLGAGYGDFVNSTNARRRIAVDTWAGMKDHLAEGVEAIIGRADQLDAIEDGAVDYAFASNLFEHISQDDLTRVLASLERVLSAKGRLTILQPNYRYAYREYFDDYTHVSVYSHESLPDFLRAHGWDVLEVHPRFLPLSVKSRLPTASFLIGLYLRMPFRPLGKQMLVVAQPRRA